MDTPPNGTDDRDAILALEGPGFTCVAVADFRAVLATRLGDGRLDLDGLTEVKRSTVRTVLRGAWEHDAGPWPVHVKLYRPVRLSDRVRDAIDGARGPKELDRLREARRRGLPAVRPLAAGRLADPGGSRSFLITETAPLGPLPASGWPAAAARAAGVLLRRAHDAGLHATDLHPGNVLVDADADESAAARLVDLTAAVFAQPLDNEERAHGIAFFCLGLDGLTEDPLAAALWDGYGPSGDTRRLRDHAFARARRLRHRLLGSIGRRALRACRETEVERDADGRRWFRHREQTGQWSAAAAFATSRPSTRPAPRRSGRRGSVWLTEQLAVKERPAAAARRLFRSAWLLGHAGVPAAAPIALCTARGRGMVFSARLPQPDLAAELADPATAPDTAALRRAAEKLGGAVGRLHAFGLRNRDLKLENLVRDPTDDTVRTVDLDGIRRRDPNDERGAGRDVGRLLAAWRSLARPDERSVARAFWRGYHRARTCLGQPPPKRLRRRIEARAREWLDAHPAARRHDESAEG